MHPSRRQPLVERALLACVALLFVLQPLAGASATCRLRAAFAGAPCCCAAGSEDAAPRPATRSCCAKRAQHDAPQRTPERKRCGCQVSAPTPLVPPTEGLRLSELAGALEGLACVPRVDPREIDAGLAARTLDPPRPFTPPPRGLFHVHLDAGLARALAFERCLRS